MTNKPGPNVKKIQRLLAFNPDLTYQQMADTCGITKQRVFAIVKQYNMRDMKTNPWDKSSRPCYGGCGKRVRYDSNKSGWCLQCKRLSNAYEFTCTMCGKFNTFLGSNAAQRRGPRRRKIELGTLKHPELQFCNARCRSRYFMKKYWNERKLVDESRKQV